VALQLLFGSDPYREAYLIQRARIVDSGNAPRYWLRDNAWNVLYRPSVGRQGRQPPSRLANER
jgi:hypothetical protein